MIRENLVSGQRDIVTRGNFEMVAVNEHGRPVAIAQNTPLNLKHQLT
jgi:acyl-CoA hydrolase